MADPKVNTAEELLRMNGVRFGEGASAQLTNEGKLVVYNTPEEIDVCDLTYGRSDPPVIDRFRGWIRELWSR